MERGRPTPPHDAESRVVVAMPARDEAPSVAAVAWVAAVPVAVLTLALIVALGPPLGGLLFPSDVLTFIPSVRDLIPPEPEPTEQARYLLALTAPLLLTLLIVVGGRRLQASRGTRVAQLAGGVRALALAFVAVCLVVQHTYRFHIDETPPHLVYFTLATLLAAAALAAGMSVAIGSARVRAAFARATADTRLRRTVGTGAALAAIVVWLLPAINVEGTIGNAHDAIATHIVFWLDETFAVLNGRPPLVDYAAQYGSLWPYAVAGTMTLFGSSVGVYTVSMATITALSMLALFATIRRVVRSTLAGLLLFVPVLATSFFIMEGPASNRYAMSNLFGAFPLRYAGPLMLLWLVARHLDGAAPRRARRLFLVAGVVLLNNADFGVPALGATCAGLLWCSTAPLGERLRRLTLEAALGLAGALVLVSALTLATTGSLPNIGLLTRFGRLFAIAGWGMMPMTPVVGLSTVIYLTYVAAIGVATVRALNGERDRLMTGLLAWSGVFGLGVGAYYMGRSHPEVLINMFAAWSFALTLLLVLAVRQLAARESRRPTVPEAACLFAFGVLVCSIPQVPLPWREVSRLQRTSGAIYGVTPEQRFIAERTRRGEAVALLGQLGHREAYDLGLVDVTTNSGGGALVTFEQVDETIVRLRALGGHKVFLSDQQTWPDLLDHLARLGYRQRSAEPSQVELTDSG